MTTAHTPTDLNTVSGEYEKAETYRRNKESDNFVRIHGGTYVSVERYNALTARVAELEAALIGAELALNSAYDEGHFGAHGALVQVSAALAKGAA